MIGAKKQVFRSKGSLSRKEIPFEDSEACCGFLLNDGILGAKEDAGAYKGENGEFILSDGCVPEAMYFLRGEGAFCAALYAEGKMYVCLTDGGTFTPTDVAFANAPQCVRVYDGEETLVLSDGVSVYLFKKTGLTACEEIPPFDCAGYAYERLWCYKRQDDSRRVKFSALADIRDFTGGGYVDMPDTRGDVFGFADVEGEFYLFRRYGVQQLIAKGKEEDFSLSDIPSPASMICKGTVCTENGAAYCLSEAGLLRFSGGKVQILRADLTKLIESKAETENVTAVACGGRVFLFVRGGRRQGVFVVDEDGERMQFLNKPFTAAALGYSPSGVAVFCCADGKVCVFGAGTAPFAGEKIWKSKAVYPFDGTVGVLEELTLCAEGEFWVRAKSEYGERSFRMVGCGGGKTVRISLRGSCFVYEVSCISQRGRVSALTAGYSNRR